MIPVVKFNERHERGVILEASRDNMCIHVDKTMHSMKLTKMSKKIKVHLKVTALGVYKLDSY